MSPKSGKNNFYVDDLLKSVPDETKAYNLLNEVTELLATGGFELTQVVSNSVQFMQSVPAEKRSKDFHAIDYNFEKLPKQKALGINWNVALDQFNFDFKLQEMQCSKRAILSVVHSIFDPLGFLAPVVLVAKRIFQLACQRNLQWDDNLSQDLREKWCAWYRQMEKLPNFAVSRCYKKVSEVPDSTQLHIYCDGSEVGYAAVAYLRFSYSQLNCNYSSLVMAKTRLVPLKSSALVTIPRVELNAAKLAVTLYMILNAELEYNFEKVVFWTDSMTVLGYISSVSKRFHRYVANRVSFIREHSNPESWNFVPGELNPADVASRGCGIEDLINNKNWLSGPKFLVQDQSEWPSQKSKINIPDDDPEINRSTVVTTRLQTNSEPAMGNVVELFLSTSSWIAIKHRVAALIRIQKLIKSNAPYEVEEIQIAEVAIWKFLQYKYFHDTVKCLQAGKTLPKQDTLIKLRPFLDSEGILRVGGRISNAEMPVKIKHPILLPGRSQIIEAFVREIHIKVGHFGKEMVLAEIRKKHWIVNGTVLIKRMLRDCLICRKSNARPMQPLMGELPKERLKPDLPAFYHIGVDCFGPFNVKRGRSQQKRYGVVYTCLTSRAIHLEMLFDLSTDSFINSFRRFIARRSTPGVVFSDNGTNFVGAVKELKEASADYNEQVVQTWLQQNEIKWKFNPPTASNFGGIWEREIRTIRKVLNGIMNSQVLHLNDEGLYTLFCEVECILNSRPLTPVSDDPDDLEALTPNHLLLFRSQPTFPPGLFCKEDVYARRKWKQVQYLADQFWSRWKKEYVPLLQQRQKWFVENRNLQQGDLVLLTDQLYPRNLWSLGRIVDVIQDDKGTVRIADVKVSKLKGEMKHVGKTSIIRRPVSKLVLLMSREKLING